MNTTDFSIMIVNGKFCVKVYLCVLSTKLHCSRCSPLLKVVILGKFILPLRPPHLIQPQVTFQRVDSLLAANRTVEGHI